MLSLSSVKGRTADFLCARVGMDFRDLSLVLLELEMDGQIRKDASGLWYRT